MEIDYEDEEMSALDLNEPGCAVNRMGHVFNLQLCFADIKSLDKIIPLAVQLKYLKELKLNSNKITDISLLNQLTALKKLTSLDLGHNPVTDISPIANLTTLEHLYANDLPITDTSPLTRLTNLEELFLHNSKAGDISALKGMTKLQHLILDQLEITDISVLKNCKSLNYLQLSNNQISDISPLRDLQLRTLILDNNKIEDLPSWLLDWDLEILWKITHLRDHICVGGNPLKNPPEEVIKKGNSAIKAWFKSNS
jgi:Leucine-rich repeat (LRR) protein